jgi:hypothetical protein
MIKMPGIKIKKAKIIERILTLNRATLTGCHTILPALTIRQVHLDKRDLLWVI